MERMAGTVDAAAVLELALLSLILSVACYATYTDLYFGVIANRATWSLLGLGLLGQLGLVLLGKVGLAPVAATFVTAFAVSYALYLYGFWAGGDAKLYWGMVVAMPTTLFGEAWSLNPLPAEFWSRYFMSFDAPAWALVINAVLLNGIFLVVTMLWRWLRHGKATAAPGRVPAAPLRVWRWLLEAGAIAGLVVGGAGVLGKSLTFTQAAVAVLVVYAVLGRAGGRDQGLLVLLPGVPLAWYALQKPGVAPVYVALWGAAWVGYTGFAYIRGRHPASFLQRLPIAALQVGMVPRQAICRVPGDAGAAASYVCCERPSVGEEVLSPAGRPLTRGMVGRLQELARAGVLQGFGSRLEVEVSLPFGPALAAGVVLAALLAGSLVKLATGVLMALRVPMWV